MSAWNEENFGNDDACAWIWELEKSRSIDMLLLSIALVIENNEYLESPECCEALAAAEVIVSVLTGDHSSIPQEAQKWLSKKQGKLGKKRLIGKNIAQIAQEAVAKILEHSELKEFWEKTEYYSKWQEIQTKLISKLRFA